MHDKNNDLPWFDLCTTEVYTNPYPTFEKMREHRVCRINKDRFYALTRFEDCKEALRNYENFSSTSYTSFLYPDWVPEICRSDLFMLSEDPPEHTVHRNILRQAFGRSAIERLREIVAPVATSLVADIQPDVPINLVEKFTLPFVGTAVAEMMGTNGLQNYEAIKKWLTILEKISTTRPSDEELEALTVIAHEQRELFKTILAERKRVPTDDIPGQLVAAEVDGKHLSDEEFFSALELLARAGFETTLHAISHAIMELAERPPLLASIVEDHSLIPKFVDELLRYQVTGPCIFRMTRKPVEVGDITIPANSRVAVLVGSANRDSDQFENAEAFDIYRPNNANSISFGFGVHKCIGSALGKMELCVALETLFSRFRRVTVHNINWCPTYMVRGVHDLHATFTE